MRSKVLTALPAFVATFGGVALYVAMTTGDQSPALIVVGLFLAVGWASHLYGLRVLHDRPVLGTWLMGGWLLALLAIGAVLTATFTWVGLRLPGWIAGEAVTDEVEELAKVLLGAATAFAAVVFTDDLDKGEGTLWPSARTKNAYVSKFAPAPRTPMYDAINADEFRQRDGWPAISGWGFLARLQRARVIATSRGQDSP